MKALLSNFPKINEDALDCFSWDGNSFVAKGRRIGKIKKVNERKKACDDAIFQQRFEVYHFIIRFRQKYILFILLRQSTSHYTYLVKVEVLMDLLTM